MKKGYAILTAGVLMVGGLFVSQVYTNIHKTVAAEDVKTNESIATVTGEGTIEAVPNVAYVDVGVTTENISSKAAQQKNKQKMNNVMDAINKYKINKKDIKTVSYYINPNYSYTDEVTRITGYTVVNTIQVTIRDLDNVGDILDATSSAGANTTGDIQYDIEDKTDLYNQALGDAVKKARVKADAIANASGLKVTAVKNIDETSKPTYYPIVYNMNTLDKAAASSSTTTPTEKGTMKITADVNAEYLLK